MIFKKGNAILFFLILCIAGETGTLCADLNKTQQLPLYQKLSKLLANLKKENSTKPKQTPEPFQFSCNDRKKYKQLYNLIVADATWMEQAKKTIALIGAYYLEHTLYLPKMPNYQLFTVEMQQYEMIKNLSINLVLYTLFYEYAVGPERMSRPLAAAMAYAYHPYQTRGLFFYWILHKLLCSTTEEKLKQFLDQDIKTWNTIKKTLIPQALHQEFESLRAIFLHDKNFTISSTFLTRLLKRIAMGAFSKPTALCVT